MTGPGIRQRFSARGGMDPGLHIQQGKVGPTSQTAIRSSGHELRHPNVHSRPNIETHQQSDGSGATTTCCQPYISQRYRPDGRSVPGSGGIVTAGTTAPTVPTVGRFSLVTPMAAWDEQVPVQQSFLQALQPWTDLAWLQSRVPIRPKTPTQSIGTDASLQEWGAHLLPEL